MWLNLLKLFGSADFSCVHRLKCLGYTFEVKAHAAQRMPKMTLQKEECKVEMGVCKPCTRCIAVTNNSLSVTEIW